MDREIEPPKFLKLGVRQDDLNEVALDEALLWADETDRHVEFDFRREGRQHYRVDLAPKQIE